MCTYHSASGSSAEDLFIELFSDTFGAEKAGYLYSQYPFSDIYQNSRFADFLIENGGRKVAIEIDDEASHNLKLVSQNKFYDDLLKQNSMIYLGWDVYRWAVRQMQQQPETVKDELRVFLGQHPSFKEIEDYLPTQRGKSLDGSQLELKEHQKQALTALEEMRYNFETIALLYHATGTGKTVTAVMDAKRFGKRTLFLAHTVELVDQAAKTFLELWPEVTVGCYVESRKEKDAFVVCGSIQSLALNLERFKPDDFGYIIVDEAHHASADTYQKVLSYFTPEFTLGLTATPERADDKNILDIFKNTAHKLDNGSMVQLARRVQEKTGCPLVQNENNDQKWWPILFVGRTALQDQPGTYSWKLRDELAEALKLLPQKEVNNPMSFAKNTILYGPPGTGKTYQTVNYAVAIIEGKSLEEVQIENHEEVLKRYRQYRQDGRIEFTTFHQSFGYEDFIEGIRPVFAEDKEENSGDISYEIADGVFKKFCATAQPPAVDPNQNPYGFSEVPTIWKVSLASTGDNSIRDYCMKHGCIRIGWDEYGETITDDMDYHVGGKTVLNAFLSRMQPGDIVLSCYTAHSIDAIGVVTGEPEWHPEFEHYKRLRTVKWLVQRKNIGITEFRLEKSLTLSTVYRLNTTVATVIDVLNKNGFSGAAPAKGTKGPYVFIIDEINRGNISKIFGELITLIEPSKRLGQSEELQAKLPYSHEAFGIPDNVYLLGTMNTADRSIALLDTALRRRFSFVEMMPDSGVLDGIEVEGISISGLLTTLNRRIEVLFDREHTLGHAFFTPLRQSPSIQPLGEIFRDKVIPLLQEYFYDDYEKICLVLGDRKRPEQQQFFKVETADLQSLFGVEPEFEVNPTYRLNPAAFFDAEVYRNL